MNKAQKQVEEAVGKWKLGETVPDEYSNKSLYDLEIEDAKTINRELLQASGMPHALIELIEIGPVKGIKADCEFGPGTTGLQTMRSGYAVFYALRIARRWAAGDRRVEIGMKYPTFNVDAFMTIFGAAKGSTFRGPTNSELRYHTYTDATGSVYTFAPDQIGKGGYAGAVMKDFAQTEKFLKFLLGDQKHYIKDLDVGYNTLGGLGIKELDQLTNQTS